MTTWTNSAGQQVDLVGMMRGLAQALHQANPAVDPKSTPEWAAADLITRLRSVVSSQDVALRNAGLSVQLYYGCDTADVMAEEIERLRAALDSIIEYWNGAPESAVDAAEEMRALAQKARSSS
jgi:hypothetical protein